MRATISLGLAEDRPSSIAALNATWRSATCRVLAAATGSRSANAGPVQFDIPLREPLVPDREPHGPATPAGRPDGKPWTYTPPVTFDQPLDIDLTPDTVVIAGHGAGVHPNLAELPTAEPTAPAPVSGGNPLHPLALPLLRPKQVIMLGRPTLHRPVSALLADAKVPVFALTTGPRWPDVSGNSQATGTRAVTTGTPDPAWLRRCAELNAKALAAVRGQLADHPLTTGLHVAAAVSDGLRPGDQLVLGASNPVRDMALVGLDTHGIRVRSNRGVAGIDGTVSTAIGAALAHERAHHGRTVALIGDLTFVHDSSGLLIGPTEPVPRDLTIVVSNDNGGGIFELLEQGDPRFSDVSSRVFGTPHDVDVGALCRAYHVESRQIEVDQPGAGVERAGRRDAGAGSESRPLVASAAACRHPGRLMKSPKSLLHILIHGTSDQPPQTRPRIVVRWVRIGVLIVTLLVTLQSVLLVAGAFRNDLAIGRSMGVAQAEVLSAGPRRSTIEFVTPDRVTYRPELGVLYPSELATGMRIYVEYNKKDPNLVRVQHRNAGLAIIPAGSIAVAAWLLATGALIGLAVLDKRLKH